jgi:murein L,D-transpeptidase YcbB/YkuD
MNSKLRNIIRDVAIGAIVGILPNGKLEAAKISSGIDEKLSLLSNSDPNISTNRPNLTLKYVYNYATNDGMFHTSHRSHASHASGSSGSVRSVTSNPKPVTDQNAVQQVTNTDNTKASYTLGQRTLKKGMEGDDVLELKKALVQAKCYKMGEYEVLDNLFDQKTVEALNLFKKNHQLTQDGIADALVFVQLKNN